MFGLNRDEQQMLREAHTMAHDSVTSLRAHVDGCNSRQDRAERETVEFRKSLQATMDGLARKVEETQKTIGRLSLSALVSLLGGCAVVIGYFFVHFVIKA